jgi:hypothetical protein
VSFEASSRHVDYILNAKHVNLRDSQQEHIIHKASTSIDEEIQNIADEIRISSSYDMKSRAMCALHNIGMLVVEPVGFLGNKVTNYIGYSTEFVEAMQSLYDNMTGTERERISCNYLEYLEQLDKKRGRLFEECDDIVKRFREVHPRTRYEDGVRRSEIANIDLTG